MPLIPFVSAVFPPAPPFTDAHLPDLTGRVIIVTGAASGVGFEVAKFLYLAGGTVYIAARSATRCQGAIDAILAETTSTGPQKDGKKPGRLESMVVDLSDLATVKPAAEEFMRREQRLDVLVHNAAVMEAPRGSVDKSGHDLEIGVNCLAPYLLTLLLEPVLIHTTSLQGVSTGDVRIVWVVSLLQRSNPKDMTFDADGTPVILTKFMQNYMQSKIGAAWLADDFGKRLGKHGILSVSLHPGLMRTELQRNTIFPMRVAMSVLFKPATYGAYSELYASFSPEVKIEHNGGHLMAWGRIADLPKEILDGQKSELNGGTGKAKKFLEYCDRQIKNFV